MKIELKELAQAILDSQGIRESSYDQEEANNADGRIVDFESFYRKSAKDAITEATKNNNLPKEIEELIYLSLQRYNDIQDWAISIGAKFKN